MTLQVADRLYAVEFNYRIRAQRKPSALPARSKINGIATCAIVRMPVAGEGGPVIALASAVCVAEDAWSKRAGRWLAFERAVQQCGLLRCNLTQFEMWFEGRFPPPLKPAPVKIPMSFTQRAELRESGHALREKRWRKRSWGV